MELSDIKISDFGLCKEINSSPPYTEYISTRWYRAPECVLLSRSYNFKMDIFAVGCIMAELYLMKPIFPGKNQVDQFSTICRVLGTPDDNEWEDANRLYPRLTNRDAKSS
jgi:serine/threonine protein kinase